MKTLPHLFRSALGTAILILSLHQTCAPLLAQEMHHGAPSVRSSQLLVRTPDGKTATWTLSSLAALPHKSVTVINGHSKETETYSGVPLSTVLAKAGVPQGESVKGALFLTAVVAEGTDGYRVLYSLAEIDPATHTGDVLIADTLDGKDLGDHGALQLVSTEDKRPARWVKNLAAITVVAVKP